LSRIKDLESPKNPTRAEKMEEQIQGQKGGESKGPVNGTAHRPHWGEGRRASEKRAQYGREWESLGGGEKGD